MKWSRRSASRVLSVATPSEDTTNDEWTPLARAVTLLDVAGVESRPHEREREREREKGDHGNHKTPPARRSGRARRACDAGGRRRRRGPRLERDRIQLA